MIKLAPSILAADFSVLGEEVAKVEQAGCEYLHLDVMDGMFVPNISFGIPVIASLRKSSKMIFDAHLMIEKPERYLEAFVNAGADIITIHEEAVENLDAAIDRIKSLGVKASVSICPETPVTVLRDILPKVDMVLLMLVHPGFGGQTLIPETIKKICELNEMRKSAGLTFDIEIDGGINCDNVGELIASGANVIVAGSSVFSGNVVENVLKFKEVFADASGGTKAR